MVTSPKRCSQTVTYRSGSLAPILMDWSVVVFYRVRAIHIKIVISNLFFLLKLEYVTYV